MFLWYCKQSFCDPLLADTVILPTKEDAMERLEDTPYEDHRDYLCEQEFRNSDIYSRLSSIKWGRKSGMSFFTKKMIREHLLKYNFSGKWAKRGERLLQRAKQEQAKKPQCQREMRFAFKNQYDDDVDYTVEFWEWWLATVTVAVFEDGNSAYGHRAGWKRHKTKVWSRPLTRKRRHQHLLERCYLQRRQTEAYAKWSHQPRQ